MRRINGQGHIIVDGKNHFVEGTEVTAEWFNDIQEELCNFIESEIPLGENPNLLKEAVEKKIQKSFHKLAELIDQKLKEKMEEITHLLDEKLESTSNSIEEFCVDYIDYSRRRNTNRIFRIIKDECLKVPYRPDSEGRKRQDGDSKT